MSVGKPGRNLSIEWLTWQDSNITISNQQNAEKPSGMARIRIGTSSKLLRTSKWTTELHTELGLNQTVEQLLAYHVVLCIYSCKFLYRILFDVANIHKKYNWTRFMISMISITVILPVVLYGCETWSLTLREETRLRVFENMVLRIFGPRRDEITEGMEEIA